MRVIPASFASSTVYNELFAWHNTNNIVLRRNTFSFIVVCQFNHFLSAAINTTTYSCSLTQQLA